MANAVQYDAGITGGRQACERHLQIAWQKSRISATVDGAHFDLALAGSTQLPTFAIHSHG